MSIGEAKKLPCRPRLVADLLLLPNLGVFLVRVEQTLFDRELDEEPRGRTGIKTQMYRMDLRTWEGRRVSWDEVREWH